MLAMIIKRAKKDGQINEIVSHLVDEGNLSYNMRMTLSFFMEHDLAKARNMKLLLCDLSKHQALKLISKKVSSIVLEMSKML
jgi:L-rhamnose isomerase